MNLLYFALAPLIFIALFKRIKEVLSAIKEKNSDKIKIEILFLSLTIVTSIFIIINVESIKK